MKKILNKKSTPTEIVVTIVFFILFFALAIIYVFPLLWAVNNSLKTGAEYFDDNFSITTSWRFDNYIRVLTGEFRYKNFYYTDMLFNSLWMLVVQVFVNVASSALLAYAVARFRFPGKNLLYAVVIFANTIPIIGAGPAAFRLMNNLGMINNPFLIWLSWASGFDFAFIVLYGYFKGISPSYSEAAYIDGASELKVFFKVIIPQVMPCIAAICITQAIGVWNNYGTVMIYMRDYPNLAYGLYLFNNESNYLQDSKPIYFAGAVISAIPVIVLYSCSQKLLLTNMTAGGLKG